MIRLLLVEDHAAIADALGALLAGDREVDVTVVTDEAQATRTLAADPPDVVLCDVMLHGRGRGFDLLERFGSASAFLMYSAFDFPAHHARALELGAFGFLSKLAPAETILAAIHRAAEGRHTYPPHVLASARSAPRPPTTRELTLIASLAQGATNEELAERLGLRVKSIEGTLRRLFDRYGLENRTQLVALAMQQGWLTHLDRPSSVPD